MAFRRRRADHHHHQDTAQELALNPNDLVSDITNWLSQDYYQTTPSIRINDGDYGDFVEDWTEAACSTTSSGEEQAATTTFVSTKTKRRRFRVPTTGQKTEDNIAEPEALDPTVLEAIAQPFVPKSIWIRVKGKEFDQPEVVDQLVQTGLLMTSSENEWIEWTARQQPKQKKEQFVDDDMVGIDTTSSHLEEDSSSSGLANGEILVHVGKCKKSTDEYYGANLPLVKTQAVIGMAPKDIAELLLDSSRVKIYNKMSVGRVDIRTIPSPRGTTKIVSNLTQPPIGKQKIKSTTMMHARKLHDDGTYLVVSRAVPGSNTKEEENEEHGKSEILLGVNLLEPHDNTKSCRITCVTHVYSPQLPSVLARRVGVKSAINFINDLRSVCEEKK